MNDENNIELESPPLQRGEAEGGLQAKCDEYLTGWKRALADYDNLKKDLAKEKEEMRRASKISIALSLLPVLDHFDQALKFKPEGVDSKIENWLQGILHVRTQLQNVLEELGVQCFGAIGDVFDPHLHESVGERAEETQPEHAIVEVLQRGWKIADFVIRPAKVIVNQSLITNH